MSWPARVGAPFGSDTVWQRPLIMAALCLHFSLPSHTHTHTRTHAPTHTCTLARFFLQKTKDIFQSVGWKSFEPSWNLKSRSYEDERPNVERLFGRQAVVKSYSYLLLRIKLSFGPILFSLTLIFF